MQYFSTNRKSAHATFREATLLGQPDDMGLYFPEAIPQFDWTALIQKSREDLAFEVIRPYVGSEIDDESLHAICSETVNFDFPLKQITPNIFALELFHGPTFAFKDVGARFMSRCLRYFLKNREGKAIVVVATSGDTGGAVAAGFHNVEGIEVVILYPKGKVSRVQELQLTTLGGNVTAIEVEGVFDDCQALAKRALADDELKSQAFLTSANSINIARWLPQQFYYFYALQQWENGHRPVISVPSGNFGNICAGILAQVSGLPVKKFIAACNQNDAVTRFVRSGKFAPLHTVPTLSNAMDVGNPSNFVRILEIFNREYPLIKKRLASYSISDEETAETMRRIYDEYGYVLDPHGAVGVKALEEYQKKFPGDKGIVLETAHPVKFDSVKEILGTYGDVPEEVNALEARKKNAIQMGLDYDGLRDVILQKC